MFEFGHPIQNLLGQQRLRKNPLTFKKLLPEKPTGFFSEACKGGNGFEPALWHFEKGEGVFLGVSGNGHVPLVSFATTATNQNQAMLWTGIAHSPAFIINDDFLFTLTAKEFSIPLNGPALYGHSSITVFLPSTPMERLTVRPEPWDRWEVPFKTV